MEAKKNWFLFAGSDHYPKGGMYDFINAFESAEAAQDAVTEHGKTHPVGSSYSWGWYHIVNIDEWTSGKRSDNLNYDDLD